MALMAVAGGTIRSISTRVPRTISRRTTTIILRNTRRNRIRTGSITQKTAKVLNTRIRRRLRSMDSSVPGPGAGQPLQRPEGTAVVQVRKVVEGHKPATSVVVQVRKVVESLKPATAVVAEGKRALLVDLARAEANVRRAIAARRAAVLLPRAVGHPAAVVGPPAAVAVAEVAVVVAEGEDVGEQEIAKNKY
jgi:hypothetical protein